MNFNIVDESGMTADELETTRLALIEYLKPLAPWNFGDSEFTIGAGDGVPIYITKRKRILSKGRFLSGYHTVENGQPVIYVNPKADRFGYFRKGKAAVPAVPARKLGFGIYTKPRPAVPARPDTIRAGQLLIVAHEVIETICDPMVDNYSQPDSLGRKWLIEVADPVHGVYYNEVINGVNCVLPDTVLPSFYDVNGQAPYSVANAPKAPFTIPIKTGYANEVIFINGVRTFKRI